MTNQGWKEHIDGLMALLLILKEGQRAFVEDNVKPFIDLEIRIAEERGRREVIEELEKIKQWPEPKPGAGEGLGALAGTGMYMQYKFDTKKHKEQIEEIIAKFNLKPPYDEVKECICSGYNENGIVNQFPSINGGTASGTASLANGKSTCGLDCPIHSL